MAATSLKNSSFNAKRGIFYGAAGRTRTDTVSLPQDFESSASANFTTAANMEVPPGFEPGNTGFADLGLTAWLWHRLIFRQKKWSGKRDSNSRHLPWQGNALPLSHSRILFKSIGGNNRARTCDPLLVRQMLSQLSYAPKTLSFKCPFNIPNIYKYCNCFYVVFKKNFQYFKKFFNRRNRIRIQNRFSRIFCRRDKTTYRYLKSSTSTRRTLIASY